MAIVARIFVVAAALVAVESAITYGMGMGGGMYGMNMWNPMWMRYNMYRMFPGMMMGFKEGDDESIQLPPEIERELRAGRVPAGWEPLPEGWVPPRGNVRRDYGRGESVGQVLAEVPSEVMGVFGNAASKIDDQMGFSRALGGRGVR